MKKYILLLLVGFFSATYLDAQTEIEQSNFLQEKAISLQVTNIQIALGFKTSICAKLSAELGIGMATLNDDFTYNDYIINVNLLYSIRKKEKSNIFAGSIGGVEFVNDPTFNLTVPYIGVMTGYEYYFGKKRRNGLSLELGYIYGKKDYKKSYSSNWGNVEYVGTFNNSPLIFGLGYSYYF